MLVYMFIEITGSYSIKKYQENQKINIALLLVGRMIRSISDGNAVYCRKKPPPPPVKLCRCTLCFPLCVQQGGRQTLCGHPRQPSGSRQCGEGGRRHREWHDRVVLPSVRPFSGLVLK